MSNNSHTDQTSELRRPLPPWFDEAKLGIFIHWGLYSVPGWAPPTGTLHDAPERIGWPAWFRDNPYAEWYANTMRIPGSPTGEWHREVYGDAPYEAFIPPFDAATRHWDPVAWAWLFKQAGARYVVLTTKHHDGFRLWPSRVPHPARGDYHPARDLVGDLARAVREVGLRVGTYYSGGLDWTFNERVVADLPDVHGTIIQDPVYVAYADAHWRELIERYETDLMWNDIGYPRDSQIATIAHEFYARNPDGVINDRVGDPIGGGEVQHLVHPDFVTPEYTSFSEIRPEKWESCRGIGFSFGYNQNEDEATFIAPDALIHHLIDVVSKGGNLLLNVGPRADGTIQEGQLRRLQALGAWLDVNGEAIYATRPWHAAEGETTDGIPVRYTRGPDALYTILLGDPADLTQVTITDLSPPEGATVHLLGHDAPLPWWPGEDRVIISLPGNRPESAAMALRISPTPDATQRPG